MQRGPTAPVVQVEIGSGICERLRNLEATLHGGPHERRFGVLSLVVEQGGPARDQLAGRRCVASPCRVVNGDLGLLAGPLAVRLQARAGGRPVKCWQYLYTKYTGTSKLPEQYLQIGE